MKFIEKRTGKNTREAKSTDMGPFLRNKSDQNGISLFLEPITSGATKSTDTKAMGTWTDGRTDGHIFEKAIFQSLFSRMKFIEKGVGKKTPAFCKRVARTQVLL